MDNIRKLHPAGSNLRVMKPATSKKLFEIRFGPWVLTVVVSHDNEDE